MDDRNSTTQTSESQEPRRTARAFGSWPSPLDLATATGESLSLSDCWLDGGIAYWLEGRPQEGGREVLVRQAGDGPPEDVLPSEYDVRTRVHEYGGAPYVVHRGILYFSSVADGRLYRCQIGGMPAALTPAGPFRYADMRVDEEHGRLLCVQEDHTHAGYTAEGHLIQPDNRIVAIDLGSDGQQAGGVSILAEGADFYMSPRLSGDGRKLAWVSWNHPQMPWFESELWVGELDASGMVASSRRVAGGADESIVQPEWSPAGILHFMSDRTGWWNLYSHDDQTGEVRALAPMEAECARPPWIFGLSSYGFLEDGTILLVAREHGTDRVYRLSPGNKPTHLDIEYKEIAWLRTEGRDVLLIGGGPMQPSSVVRLDPDSGTCHVLRRAAEIPIDPEYISPAEPITFSSAGGRQVHGYYFMPHNPEYSGLPGELPPLVVFVHGGPTAQTSQTLDFITQVFTSRGIATVAVDYSGSTGHGREYRRRLIGQWGIVDAEDCVYAARYLVETGRADPERVAIRGGSSGGYAVLCALTFHDYFRAGTSMYGIADLELLAGDTHKLESHYMASLVGPYPEEKQRYHDRSPFHFMDRMTRPLLILQGLDDKVVPPNQAELMARTLRANHVPYAYVTFEGEGHGFRTAAHILRALEAELSFYAQVFGFTPADDIEPIHVEYLDGGRSRQTTP